MVVSSADAAAVYLAENLADGWVVGTVSRLVSQLAVKKVAVLAFLLAAVLAEVSESCLVNLLDERTVYAWVAVTAAL